MKIMLVGGDSRFVCLANIFAKAGWDVSGVAMENSDMLTAPSVKLQDAGMHDMIVLPFVYADQNGFIPTPNSKEKQHIAEVLEHALPTAKIFCGKADEKLLAVAKARGFVLHDLLALDVFAARNAVPSAEGAIFYAMNKLNYMLCGEQCVVIGFGRIGQLLSSMLKGLGAIVTVAARRAESRAIAQGLSHKAIDLNGLKSLRGRFVVFNTVPEMVFGHDQMVGLSQDSLILDLASAPFGVDVVEAERLKLRAYIEPGIPGRYSPETAATILYDTICELLLKG